MELAICILEQALYPVKHVTWCVYALFIDNEERIKRDCKYSVTKASGNRAISLGGYLWALSSVRQEQLQVRCLEETHVIEIQPPLQIVYLGNGCEGYSPSMFLPAKNEMITDAQIESRKEYFLQFNYVYCHGMTKLVKLVKVHRKDQSVNKNAILASFVCFFNFPDRNLIILYKIT